MRFCDFKNHQRSIIVPQIRTDKNLNEIFQDYEFSPKKSPKRSGQLKGHQKCVVKNPHLAQNHTNNNDKQELVTGARYRVRPAAVN